jgi:hypothetical protein
MCTIGDQFSYFCKQDTIKCSETHVTLMSCGPVQWGFVAFLSFFILCNVLQIPLIVIIAITLRSSGFNLEI